MNNHAPLATEYAPYNTLPGFIRGFEDYQDGFVNASDQYTGVAGQAYDRGREFAMRVNRWYRQQKA